MDPFFDDYVCIYCDKVGQHLSVDCPVLAAETRKRQAEIAATTVAETLSRFVNGMQTEQADAFATALANLHPTLLGQIAKAVGIGVMRRALYDPGYKPFDRITQDKLCQEQARPGITNHARHDGRLSCDTVIGAELMAHQAYI